ncbi:hypothetical protein BpHYR1_023645 [Brachionus plicatilis]|uniref:Uncharacterized protein n=1 Tax=Brachionus plicatilis TaxID=10195 RepID=A0A3M7RU15_BRAPC|nr:hypothetical protein BpHYR1_023645 [Brachionus plicatilis]
MSLYGFHRFNYSVGQVLTFRIIPRKLTLSMVPVAKNGIGKRDECPHFYLFKSKVLSRIELYGI